MGDIAIASFQVMQVFNTSVKMTPGDPLNDGLLGNEQRFKISWVAGAAGDVIESLGKAQDQARKHDEWFGRFPSARMDAVVW
ncbi:predicted protein [Plenodomus lingam JN3]|uniref:Predicted protein n=1 Tax=Leptosphaeria maculans (strain JN3 / isolate v23.1.3 / race Av1-4-5-6-7-8) TaxID=985895 RepID=E5AAL6_LEPMJ|nr:predicted protein [Plenodomus lingam JN3]CBY00707.1 predicted protein [Plenodomus lingam JN3]